MQSLLALLLTLVYFPGGSWQEADVRAAAAQAGQILGQCGIAPVTIEVVRADVEARFRAYRTPTSRELARRLQPRKPAIFFVDVTRQDPAFDAEAIGRGNSRGRPELRDTVWVVKGARDLEVVLAHELAHVLMDSGEHSDEPGNLMRDETAPGATRLSDAQCVRLRATGTANGLLEAPR
jgi:Zn-dependent protease with chaperone function